jgi:outer membrane protein OmpA-like peptidoglycan-associated protein
VEKSANGWGTPVNIGSNVNSNYLESTASITPDGKIIYFASNRIGGFGGMDIYKVEKNSKGVFGQPVNLGPTVNTAKDEDAPFIHPDQKTLFFTSDGHNTMGGKDIFKTTLKDNKYTKPENMGYPINTPANDNYFTLTADGRKGYFSSDRKGGFGGQDIYTFDMPEEDANIPLTLVKGRILAGEDLKPVPTTIKVVDNTSSQKVDFVYNPNKETGDYLIIFPPGKNYDMIIESLGYMPYAININVPDQNYFYELYQQIHLKPIKQFDVIVGQEVIVKNAFYDTHTSTPYNNRKANEAMLIKNDSIDVLELMDAIIASNDQVAYEYLLELMFLSNPIDAVNFNENEEKNIESANRIYYYDESEVKDLEAKKIGKETIFTLPTMYVTELAKQQKKKDIVDADYDKKLLEPLYKLYFDIGKSDLKPSYLSELDKVMVALKNHQNLGIEISGYASAEGDVETNRNLSNKRAIEVLNYFNHKGVVRRRIIAKGYGATKSESNNMQESRRVEIRIIDLNKIY